MGTPGEDGLVRVWDPVAGTLAGDPLAGHTGPVSSVAFGTMNGDRDGGKDSERVLLASASEDHTVRVWDPLTGHCIAILRRRNIPRCLAARGPLLAIGDDDGLVVIELDGVTGQAPHP